MKRLLAVAILIGLCGVALGVEEAPKPDAKSNAGRHGLVAHYYRDVANWGGNWRQGEKPEVPPAEWTFTRYDHSRVEPLVNHLFVRRGWFSVRWKGVIKIPGRGSNGAADVQFEIWADDGCRLKIDGETIIDDWRDVAEDATDSHRSATANLTAGEHSIVVEYFQGESLRRNDRDPIKLYWQIPSSNVPKQIIPASRFTYTSDDLFPDAGRLDPQGEEFLEQLMERIHPGGDDDGDDDGEGTDE